MNSQPLACAKRQSPVVTGSARLDSHTAAPLATARAAACVVALLICLAGCSGDPNTNVVGEPDMVFNPTAVHCLGRLEPTGTVLQLAAPSGNEGGVIAELLVEEGQDVLQSQVLARLDLFPRRQSAVIEAEARLRAANARLEQILAGSKIGDVKAAEAAVKTREYEIEATRRDRDRAQRLFGRSAGSTAEVDDAQLAFDRAVQEHLKAGATLASIREIRDVDLELQRAEISVAAAALRTAEAHRDAAEITAPSAGKILRIRTRLGEQVGEQGLLEMGQVSRMQAVAEVFEGDLGFVYPGQHARVVIDTTGQTLRGRVTQIGHIVARKVVLTNDPVSDTDARVVEVRIELDPGYPETVSRLSNARVQVHLQRSGQDTESERPSDDLLSVLQ